MNLKHFEQLWEESEQLASKVHATNDVMTLINGLLKDYTDLSTLELPDEVKSSLRKRYMGEIVFLLTALSARDNINVYAALSEEMKLNE